MRSVVQLKSKSIESINHEAYSLLTSVANIPGRFSLRASSCGNLVVPRTRRRNGDRAFSVAAPRAWNRLPTELKLLRSTDSFRRDLKTFLFHSVYGQTRIQTDSVMRPRSSIRGRNKSASVTVIAQLHAIMGNQWS